MLITYTFFSNLSHGESESSKYRNDRHHFSKKTPQKVAQIQEKDRATIQTSSLSFNERIVNLVQACWLSLIENEAVSILV